MTNKDDCYYPTTGRMKINGFDKELTIGQYGGCTKLEEFTKAAMTAILHAYWTDEEAASNMIMNAESQGISSNDHIGAMAVRVANATLDALNKGEEES